MIRLLPGDCIAVLFAVLPRPPLQRRVFLFPAAVLGYHVVPRAVTSSRLCIQLR